MEQEQMPQRFDPGQFDYARFYPSDPFNKFINDINTRQKTHFRELLCEVAEGHPDIPQACYEAYCMMDATIYRSRLARWYDPRVYVPLINKTYQQLRANGEPTDLATIQRTATLELYKTINETTSYGAYPHQRHEAHLVKFFTTFTECAEDFAKIGQLEIDITKQL